MEQRKVSPLISLIPIIFLIAILYVSVVVYKIDVHIPIFISAMFATLIGVFVLKTPWEVIEEGIFETIKLSLIAIIILMVIGMVIGSWIQSGVVPTMIYYGLQIISPKIFLLAALILSSIVSLATGSSWTTAGTVGIALVGIGTSLGIPSPIIGGAIISGAYFGDKMSPLSDTTNLAPAMSGATLFEHIRHMFYTTVPTYIIAAILFVIIGLRYGAGTIDTTMIAEYNTALTAQFHLSPLLLLIPVITIALVVMKVPAIPGLFIGALLGSIAAMLFQGVPLGDALNGLHYGYESATGMEAVDELLTRGGLDSMMWTISLILCAMIFGGVMETTGMLGSLVDVILKIARGVGGLVTATIVTCIFINFVTADQYLSIVITGRMYKTAYEAQNLHPKNLSRALEDSGTLTSPLIPWNTCGAFMIEALAIEPWSYVPYAFVNWLNPIVSIIYGFTGFSMEKLDKTKDTATV